MARKKTTGKPAKVPRYDAFEHPEAQSLMRPDVGAQAAFKKKKPPVTYRYDSSLLPSLDRDGLSDPITIEIEDRRGDDVPAWFLDTNYKGLCLSG